MIAPTPGIPAGAEAVRLTLRLRLGGGRLVRRQHSGN